MMLDCENMLLGFGKLWHDQKRNFRTNPEILGGLEG
jgi:hypothetical protein